MKRLIQCFFILTITPFFVFALPEITDQDILLEKSDNGYDLYIKKYPEVNSILLTESQKDPQLKKTNYGLRTSRFHPANGDEIRILDNQKVHTKDGTYFLIDSTPELHPRLGDVFRFFIPELVYYGYPWSRQGFMKIRPGIRINLRIFRDPFSDYNGPFRDQWIVLKLSVNESKYRDGVIEKYKELGKSMIKDENEDLKNYFINTTKMIPDGESADIVFIMDTTESMKEEIPIFRNAYQEIKQILKNRFAKIRIGLILYKDYGSSYLYKNYELTQKLDSIEQIILQTGVQGGDDIPEAVYEAVHVLRLFKFESRNRFAFLIGDAPPHPKPRGNVNLDDVRNTLQEQNIELITLPLPYKN